MSGAGAGEGGAADTRAPWPSSLPPAPLTSPPSGTSASFALLNDALVAACGLTDGLGAAVAQTVVAGDRLADLEVLAADQTLQRLVPGMQPGIRLSQLLTPQMLHSVLWQVWSHPQLRIAVDNRDNATPELLAGAVFEVVQLVAGSTVVWLAVDHSDRQHWQDRALQAAVAVQAAARTASDQRTQVADQLFDALVGWTLVRDGGGSVVDAVVSELNRAALQLVAHPVRVGRRLSELVAPQYLPLVLAYFERQVRTGEVDSRLFGPEDLEVHLVRALHGRVRVFATGPDTVTALFADDTALTELAAQSRRALHRLAHARDDEGRRIAALLHDGPLQALSSARWELEGALGGIGGPAAAAVRRAQEGLDGAEAALRSEIFALSPPELDRSGMFVAIASLGERARAEGRDVIVALTGEPGLRRDDELLLVRCVQELLRNIEQHASATSVTVSVDASEERVEVVVGDDGVGFDASDPAVWLGREHFGLASCKLLLELAGGGMWVEATPGGGVTASCWLPQGQQVEMGDLPGAGLATDRRSLWQASVRAAALRQEFERATRRGITSLPDGSSRG
jgi:signal transduction histidine kinase